MPIVKCFNCGAAIVRAVYEVNKSKTGRFFCNHVCRHAILPVSRGRGTAHTNWRGGRSSYRLRALMHYGAVCANVNCPISASGIITPVNMFDVDHIDSDRSNNELMNLQVLCVWCHTAKTRKLPL